MSPHQEATASSDQLTHLRAQGIYQSGGVESPTRPWSRLSCFEATPSIQVSNYYHVKILAYIDLLRGVFLSEPHVQALLSAPHVGVGFTKCATCT